MQLIFFWNSFLLFVILRAKYLHSSTILFRVIQLVCDGLMCAMFIRIIQLRHSRDPNVGYPRACRSGQYTSASGMNIYTGMSIRLQMQMTRRDFMAVCVLTFGYSYPVVLNANTSLTGTKPNLASDIVLILCLATSLLLNSVVNYWSDLRVNAEANRYLGFRNMEDIINSAQRIKTYESILLSTLSPERIHTSLPTYNLGQNNSCWFDY